MTLDQVKSVYGTLRHMSWRTAKWGIVRYLVGSRSCVINARFHDSTLMLGDGSFTCGLRQTRSPMVHSTGNHSMLVDCHLDHGTGLHADV